MYPPHAELLLSISNRLDWLGGVERRIAARVGRFHVRAVLKEQLGDVNVAFVAGEMERRQALILLIDTEASHEADALHLVEKAPRELEDLWCQSVIGNQLAAAVGF